MILEGLFLQLYQQINKEGFVTHRIALYGGDGVIYNIKVEGEFLVQAEKFKFGDKKSLRCSQNIYKDKPYYSLDAIITNFNA